MAEGGLTGNQIMRLSSAITTVNMKKIATGYMGIGKEVVRNIESANRDDQEGINSDILDKWKNKPQNSGPDQVKRLAALLYEAAERGYVNAGVVKDILRVPIPSDTKTGHAQAETSDVSTANTGPGTLPETDPELTDEMILSLSKKLTNKTDLHTLAITGLGMKDDTVGTSLTDNSTEITMAAKKVLTTWLRGRANAKVAYKEMVEGLEKAELNNFINCLSQATT